MVKWIYDDHGNRCSINYFGNAKAAQKALNSLKKFKDYSGEEQDTLYEGHEDPTIGKYCIVRTYNAGVFAGIVQARLNQKIVLKDSRRLFAWKALQGVSLSEVSQYGINTEESQICCIEPIKVIEDVEITPCSDAAKETIVGAKTYEP